MDYEDMVYDAWAEEREREYVSPEQELRADISEWLKETNFRSFCRVLTEQVIGQPEVENIALSIYSYMERIARGLSVGETILLCAPSGTGKTELFRCLAKYYMDNIPDLPIYQFDCSGLSEEGFKGLSPISIVNELFAHHYSNGIGIVFLDEFDKKILPSWASLSNVNAAVQHGLLTVMEGRICKDEKTRNRIDTNNSLFICCGAFDYIREKREDEPKTAKLSIGFGSTYSQTISQIQDHFAPISRQDLVDAGANNELIGRISAIFNFKKLDDEDIRTILQSLITKKQKEYGIRIEANEEAINELISSYSIRYGCRLIIGTLNDRIRNCYKLIKLQEDESKQYKIVLGKEDTIEPIEFIF